MGRTIAPWLAGGKVSTSSAALGSAGGLVNAEGAVGGGGPKSSSGTALAVVRVRSIVQGGLDLSSKAMELHDGVARFIFHPSRHAESGKPRRLHDVRDDSCCGYQGVMQLMSHYNRAKKKFKLINKLFLSVSSERKGEGGIFLKLGGKRPVGWV
ncbi:hypothetical protein [Pseudomonas sp. R5(2019)]|uniref:hypothetical protein n=1 Tax=Pseudomonas sp. R5(2019) TaxID=2697566 RepID=UPI0021140688|nr:hypothetical protein [Pseudomonas sp. R5(2019)]